MTQTEKAKPVIEVQGLTTQFGDNVVHKDLNFEVLAGEIFAIVGGSGSGKTTLLREILLLQPLSSGSIKILGTEVTSSNFAGEQALRRRFGVMFQLGALFSSLTVLENVAFALKEFTHLPEHLINELALLKLRLVGLENKVAHRYPSEISGGMIKRVAIARALAMDPQILFLDEPTAGLDPDGASGIDDLVLDLNASLGVTIVLVTHDLDTLSRVPDRIAFLGEGRVLTVGPLAEVAAFDHPLIHDYFSGPRAHNIVAKAKQGA